jgi:small-conductance mechanosensitive channel
VRKNLSIAFLSILLMQLVSMSDSAHAQTAATESSKRQDLPTIAPIGTEHDAKLAEESVRGVPLRVGGEEILRFKTTISGFTPEQRVAAIDQRIAELIKKPDFAPRSIILTDTGYSTDLVCGNAIILTVTDRDASALGFKDRQSLAQDCCQKLSRALVAEKASHSPRVILIALGSTALATFILIVLLLSLAKFFPQIYRQIESLRGRYIRSLRIQKAELLSEESLTEVVVGVCRIIRGAVTLAILLVYFERVLSFFPSTRRLSTEIVDSTLIPMVGAISSAVCAYMPNLVFIALILTSSYYLITFTNFIFREIGRGKITVSDFDPEWADPTYKIARFLIVAFTLVLIFPYLPGSGSPAFQQVSLFLGVLISLGSSGAVSNIVAGIFLTYTGAFRLGDRVKISDTIGDVMERKLLYTRVRTIKDEYITIPNSMVLSAHIVNYSSSMKRNGLILHTSVTISYDVEWREVEKLLLAAAASTTGVLTDPAPFVLVTTLDEFYVTHEINCYTGTPHMMAIIYADLHKAILDQFSEANVEIMSPAYYSIRNGEHSMVPARSKSSKE